MEVESVQRGKLSGKMTSIQITGKQFDDERKAYERSKQSIKSKARKNRFSPFRQMVQSLNPGEAIKIHFDDEKDYAKCARAMYNINHSFRDDAKKRGIDNWHEFEMVLIKSKLTMLIRRNKIGSIKEENYNGMAV